MATIDDVAKASGVSKGTVSSVFSKKRPISKEVTERVLAAAKSLHYKPNYWARSLASRTTRILGLNIRGESLEFGQFHHSLLNGVLRVCYDNGYRLLVNTLSPAFLSQVENISSDPVDGEILLDPIESDGRIEERLQSGMPIVVIGRPPGPYEAQVSYVDNDNAGMAAQVTRYLIELGHTEILFLNAPVSRTVSEDRGAGYRNALALAGLRPKPELMMHKPLRGETAHAFGYEAALAKLIASPDITAVIADTDMMALGVYKAAERLGLRIPEQLSVFAFSDDSVLSPEFSPPLTGTRLHADRLGAEALQLLLEQLNAAQKSAKRVLVPTELVIRGSCAAPAARGS
ncbi:LacI family DNA-binding transcriptional regulator [Paenibacillus sacheonensis]|uniref:Substrate-binding domain-containing protein n=1 Tax=Paenibacillus sacheonensis TaxID=742054 RepID=A0A7X4YUQ3_9BACL|nr:LacI family DNA-binding transcriptional regulator [Paenibacillus sacheonensis]MBM7567801.1 DNA-binding LacI/PurR family transcriptional regulator [Paenibacillus sacheonensis]NBC71931.1 substrate-binding domain-containing protein [Paenibacillus sacheonensis]